MLTWWQWAILGISAFLVGLSKTGITGIGILAVALAAGVLPARESVGAMLIILIAGDIFAVAFYRRSADWGHLWRLFPWAAIGVVLGALTLWLVKVDNDTIRRWIGVILIVLIVADLIRRWRLKGGEGSLPGILKQRWAASLTGVAAGITTMIANAAGPIMTIYLLAANLPKYIFLGTSAWYFLVMNLFKVPFSMGLKMITFESAGISLRLLPLVVAGAFTGRWIVKYIDEQRFVQIVLILTLIASIKLLF